MHFDPSRTFLAALAVLFAAPALGADESIIGSLCVGNNCAAIEPFGDTTLKLRETAPRIEMVDINTTPGGSPRSDWQIEANSVSLTGGEYLAVRNLDESTVPFVIRDGAPNQAFNITADGLGLGTYLPQADIHIISGGTPSIRFEESTSDSIWSLTAGSTSFAPSYMVPYGWIAPLRIWHGAPGYSLMIRETGNIGMGTLNPDRALHLRRMNSTASVLIEEAQAGPLGQLTLRNNGITWFTLEDTSIADVDYSGRKWNFQNQAGTFRVTTPPGGPGEIEMLLTPQGDMHIKGSLYTGGACAAGCDAVFRDGYPLPTLPDQMAMIRERGHLPAVGPTAEDGPFDLTAMSTGMLNELEKAYLYIDQLHARDRQRAADISTLRAELARLSRTVSQLQNKD